MLCLALIVNEKVQSRSTCKSSKSFKRNYIHSLKHVFCLPMPQKKPCNRPKGCCRFFHPPEHIRLLLIHRRHVTTASTIMKRRLRKSSSIGCYSSSNQAGETKLAVMRPPSCPRPIQHDPNLTATDRHAFEAIQLLSGLMNYGQMLRTCAAITNSHEVVTAPPETQGDVELKPNELELAAAVINRQLTAYAKITNALQTQLTNAASD